MLKKRPILVCWLLAITAVASVIYTQDITIKIGAIFDLSGDTQEVGTPYAEGVTAYVDWINSQGGIEGRPVELLSRDYASDIPTAERLYAQFRDEGIVVFLGWGTGDSEALRSRTAADRLPFISASYAASLNAPRGEAPYNFLVGTTYSDQMVVMLRFMLDEWINTGNDAYTMKAAFFYSDSPFGKSPLEDGEAFAAENGITTLSIPMAPGTSNFTAGLTQAVNFGATHIIIQNTASPAASLLRNAEDIGLLDTIQFGCLNWCASELLIRSAGGAAEGMLGALPFVPTTVDVPGLKEPKAWLAASGSSLEEATLHFTQGWWTMAVAAEGIRLTLAAGKELTGENIRASLETLTDFDTGGVTAPITFRPDDHRGSRSVTIYRVESGAWTEVSGEIDLRAAE